MSDLRVDDEDRYHYVEDVPYLERDYTLRVFPGFAGSTAQETHSEFNSTFGRTGT